MSNEVSGLFLTRLFYCNSIMDTQIVEVRKNIVIYTILDHDTSFTFSINTVDFIPDEVIVNALDTQQTMLKMVL